MPDTSALPAYTAGWLVLQHGMGPLRGRPAALGVTTAMAALFGLRRAARTGLSFLMITLAFGQILWGVAYRWAGVTGGDNGLSGLTRPALRPQLGLASGLLSIHSGRCSAGWGLHRAWVRSPFGASICAPATSRAAERARLRRLADPVDHFVVSGFSGGSPGCSYVYYHQFISPHSLSLANSAEMLLMVIAGGPGTLVGPLLGAGLVVLLKNVVSAYVDRWIMLLGIVYVLIVLFLPGGVVAGVERLIARLDRGRRGTQAPQRARSSEPAR